MSTNKNCHLPLKTANNWFSYSPEPILVPRLRIRFADFPYLHWPTTRGCSPWRPAAVMGTAACETNLRARIFKGRRGSNPDRYYMHLLCRGQRVRFASQPASAAHPTSRQQEQTSLAGSPASGSGFFESLVKVFQFCTLALPPWCPHAGAGILTGFPFGASHCSEWF